MPDAPAPAARSDETAVEHRPRRERLSPLLLFALTVAVGSALAVLAPRAGAILATASAVLTVVAAARRGRRASLRSWRAALAGLRGVAVVRLGFAALLLAQAANAAQQAAAAGMSPAGPLLAGPIWDDRHSAAGSVG